MTLYGLTDFLEQLETATGKVQGLGVRIGGTRVARYLQILRKAAAAEARGDLQHQPRPPFVNALNEGAELIDIATLDPGELTDRHVRDKLSKLSSGPEVMAPDGPDPARDYAFEFATAARAKANGLLRGFPPIGDVAVGADATPVECKRISSLKQVARRVKEARDQLTRGTKPGIIALDLTRPILIAQGPIAARDDDTLMATTDQQLVAYSARHLVRRVDISDLAVPSVLGLLVRFASVGTAGDVARIRRTTAWHQFAAHTDDSELNRRFLHASAFLGPQPTHLITLDEVHAATAAVHA